MPRLSDSMEEGTVLTWLVEDATEVAEGEEIVEIETDKATMVCEAEAAGKLHIVAAPGTTLPVGALIATIGAAPPAAAERSEPKSEAAPATSGDRVAVSPVARRIARERGIDLAAITGSGPGGRIGKADVLAAEAPAPAPAAAAQNGAGKPTADVVELSRSQQVVARRMVEARQTVPSFEVSVDVDMERAHELRAQLAGAAPAEQPPPSFNDLVVKACALALREMPRVNASYREGHFELHHQVNVGVAVASEDTLLVPTVFDADRKSLREIADTTRGLVAQVRAGTIAPAQLAGGTFTVSNLGMFGVDSFTAVPNVPQAAILAVGAIAPRLVPLNGAAAVRRGMTLTLTCDHRILYGADAARFLARLRELLEQPLALAMPGT